MRNIIGIFTYHRGRKSRWETKTAFNKLCVLHDSWLVEYENVSNQTERINFVESVI